MTLSDHSLLPASPGARVNRAPAGFARGQAEAFHFGDTPRLSLALRAGEDAAFRWLHAQWNERLLRYAFAVTGGDAALAQEVVQSAYVRASRHLRELPDEAALWAWLARASRDALTDLRRKGGRYLGALARFAAWFRTVPPAEDDGLVAALDAALAQLEPEDRALVEARYFRREPLEATGERLGCTARAVEGRLSRAREKLRRLIAAQLKAS